MTGFEKNNEIVTVAVITYNSSNTVKETLDSIVKQTYSPKNIEVIISDDCSIDDTVFIIKEWLNENKKYFHRVKFIPNERNVGVTKNCNVAWFASSSRWIKTIAGDDILMPTCIEDNVKFANDYNDEKIAVIFSKMQSFKVDSHGRKESLAIMPSMREIHFFNLSASEQVRHLQKEGITGAPSAFINRSILEKIGFGDERFKMIEDHPLWFKITLSGYKLHFMDKVTVFYRIGDSLSRSKTILINTSFIKEIINIDEKLLIPSMETKYTILVLRKKIWPRLILFISRIFKNKRNFISVLFLFSAFLIRPGFLKFQLAKLINKK
ncbi:glycosyltransferase family 2 protein [Edwardsiella tarda]|uniref:glycosyltransferase family 2 protein n=1 Tax=Edwardsiella tarda TaxID=636 RepID=UPI003F659ADB